MMSVAGGETNITYIIIIIILKVLFTKKKLFEAITFIQQTLLKDL
jgi:hypothetical protein